MQTAQTVQSAIIYVDQPWRRIRAKLPRTAAKSEPELINADAHVTDWETAEAVSVQIRRHVLW